MVWKLHCDTRPVPASAFRRSAPGLCRGSQMKVSSANVLMSHLGFASLTVDGFTHPFCFKLCSWFHSWTIHLMGRPGRTESEPSDIFKWTVLPLFPYFFSLLWVLFYKFWIQISWTNVLVCFLDREKRYFTEIEPWNSQFGVQNHSEHMHSSGCILAAQPQHCLGGI